MGKLRAIVWTLIRREEEPERVDWAALFCLFLYAGIGGSFVITVTVLSARMFADW